MIYNHFVMFSAALYTHIHSLLQCKYDKISDIPRVGCCKKTFFVVANGLIRAHAPNSSLLLKGQSKCL